MNNSIKFQLEKLAETIEQFKHRPCDFPADGGWTAEDIEKIIEKIDVHALEHRIYEYIENHQNRERANISRALKSMRLAIGCSDSTDRNLTRHARKLLKSWCHPLRSLRNSADHFADLFDQLNISEVPKFDQIIPVYGDYALAMIKDIKQVRYVGKALGNCVADYEYANQYMNRYRDGEILIFTLLKDGEPMYLLTITKRDKCIDQFEAKDDYDDSDNELPYELAIGILNKLNVTALYIEEFVQAGAFSRFKSGRPETTPIEINGIEFWVWSYPDEFIIAMDSNSDGRLSWSHYKRPFPQYCMDLREIEESYNALELAQLFELAIQSETLMNKLVNPTHH